jgi:hypothetical protein
MAWTREQEELSGWEYQTFYLAGIMAQAQGLVNRFCGTPREQNTPPNYVIMILDDHPCDALKEAHFAETAA